LSLFSLNLKLNNYQVQPCLASLTFIVRLFSILFALQLSSKYFLDHSRKQLNIPMTTNLVVTLHQQVLSDRGPRFIAGFTRELYRLLGIKLATSTAYHPQTDGQMEHFNQELEGYLQNFTSQ
jgi:transposase InsO family protein